MKVILLTGGGTSGHVTPNIALISKLKKMGYSIHYVGSRNGIEKKLIENENIPYYEISAGKLRRYLDFKNFTDVFRVMNGLRQSLSIISKVKPDIVFSKGGFVSCPVVWAAWLKRVPVVIHESDYTPGLTNKLSMPFAKKVCYTFPETKEYIKGDKGVLTGIPIRDSLLKGDKNTGKKLCGFNDSKPVIMVIGGSQGSENINKAVRRVLDTLLKEFQVCHICGKGNIDKNYEGLTGYKQFEYLNEELPHVFAMADMVISRAGATTIFEILALKKPSLLIPLSRKASRGDQILNAKSFAKQGFSLMLEEEDMNDKTLIESIREVYTNRGKYINAIKSKSISSAADEVIKVIKEMTK